jgi:hypothetical protein
MTMPKGWPKAKKPTKHERASVVDTIEQKKWLMDQTKYNIQLANDSIVLEWEAKSEQIKNLLSVYDIALRGILAGMVFVATFAISVSTTNLGSIPLGEILLIDFTVGPLIYVYFVFFRVKIFRKFPKITTAFNIMLSIINSIKGAIVNRSLHLNDVSVKQLILINTYLAIATLSRFPLERAYNEILSSSALEYYHKMIKNELKVHQFAIATAFSIFIEKKEELLNEEFIVGLDNSVHGILNSVFGQGQLKPLLNTYNELNEFLTKLYEKTQDKTQSIDRYIIGTELKLDKEQTDTIVDRLVSYDRISKGVGSKISIPKDGQ